MEPVEAVGLAVVLNHRGEFGEVTVNGEAKGLANGGNAVDYVSAINGGGIPGIDGTVSRFGGDFGVT